MEKMKKHTNIVQSEAEKKEQIRKRIYLVLPVISVVLLILFWFAASSAENSNFPSPGAIWSRYLLLMEKPIKKLNLYQHIWARDRLPSSTIVKK